MCVLKTTTVCETRSAGQFQMSHLSWPLSAIPHSFIIFIWRAGILHITPAKQISLSSRKISVLIVVTWRLSHWWHIMWFAATPRILRSSVVHISRCFKFHSCSVTSSTKKSKSLLGLKFYRYVLANRVHSGLLALSFVTQFSIFYFNISFFKRRSVFVLFNFFIRQEGKIPETVNLGIWSRKQYCTTESYFLLTSLRYLNKYF
jgi:hypothetical protein